MKKTAYPLDSIGHGNRSSEQFLAMLSTFGIEYLNDIRSHPCSKRNPQFNRENLEVALDKNGISYTWLMELGGFRGDGLTNKSPHVAFRNLRLRKYAAHMSTESFRAPAHKLSRLVSLGPACFMCAEALPQRCHRLLVSDFLWVQGIKVIHILDSQRMLSMNSHGSSP